MAAAVMVGPRLLFAGGWGSADLRCGLAATSRVPFPIGSISKSFLAAAVLQLVERGVVALTTSIVDCLPGLPSRRAPVELRHLLAHTSGVDGSVDAILLRASRVAGDIAPTYIVDAWGAADACAAPGARWEYSNAGYAVLGAAVEVLTGRPLGEHLAKAVISQAGLSCQSITTGPPPVPRATGHVLGRSGYETVDSPLPGAAFASGDLYASAEDLAAWAHTLATGCVLGTTSRRAMMRRAWMADGSRASYGLGCYVAKLAHLLELSHDGNTSGCSTQVAYYPRHEIAIAVVTNGRRHTAEATAQSLARTALGLEVRSPLSSRWARHTESVSAFDKVSSVDLNSFVGEYAYGGQRLPVFERGNRLQIRTPSGRCADLERTADTCFVEVGPSASRDLEYEFLSCEHYDETSRARVTVRRAGKVVAVALRLSRNLTAGQQ